MPHWAEAFMPTGCCVSLFGCPVVARNPAPKAAVDQLIPWLLDENNQLRGVPFSEVITDVTAKKSSRSMPRPKSTGGVVKGISAASDKTIKKAKRAR
jgi:hypothetical protein